jgi:hypothetical protein
MMEASQSQKRRAPKRPEGPLGEVYRRITRAHASLAESVGDDPERRGWVLRELMETLRYIESLPENPAAS